MKTINTVLPVYDSANKLCYHRAIRNNPNGLAINAVPTPRFRLPSMHWNVEADDPGPITAINLVDKDGVNAVNTKGFAHWKRVDAFTFGGWYNVTFTTFTIAGLDITSGIMVPIGGGTAYTQYFQATAGERITISGTIVQNSGPVPFISLYSTVGLVSFQTLSVGAGSYSWTIATSGLYYFRITAGDPGSGSNFSFTSVSFESENFLNHFWDGSSCIMNVVNSSYDTLAASPLVNGHPNKAITKTTAIGEASASFVMSSGPIAGYTSLRYRYDIYLTLNSGVAPKVELRDSATGLTTRSNTVQLADGRNIVILAPTNNDGATNTPIIFNDDGDQSNFNIVFAEGVVDVYEPALYSKITDEYFQYNGDTLLHLLPTGEYRLKITTENGYVYHSEYFRVDCVFSNLISAFTNSGYETFSSSGTTILHAVSTGGTDYAITESFEVKKGESIKVILNLNLSSGTLPYVYLINQGWTLQDAEQLAEGLNEITLTATWSGTAYIIVYNETIACDFLTSEILVLREYSEKYLTINFSNTCDLGDILYQAGLEQTLYFESETMEPSFPLDEEGQKNGEGRFVRTFGRQVKKYAARTLEMPDYIVELFNRMKLHDTVELIDLVGNVNDVYNLEVEHEWLFDDKYYAKIDLTFDYDEAFVVHSCCENFT